MLSGHIGKETNRSGRRDK